MPGPSPVRSTPLHTEAAGAAPDAFGSFRVLHQIGTGVLGPVFRAYDPEQDRLVAVKVFRADAAPDAATQLRARLQHLIDADLAHPAIAVPISTGIVDGSVYLAQDFVAADTLDSALREFGAAPLADALRVATQVGGALDFAAALGVFHGSLHPGHVMVAADDSRVTGLGVTQALETVGGTPPVRRPYSAPERVDGQPWDSRADIYSLGVIVAEALTGRWPENAENPDAPLGRLDDLLSGVSPNTSALIEVLRRALAQRPEDRYDTASAFADALKAVVGHLPDVKEPSVATVDLRPADQRPAAWVDLTLAARPSLDDSMSGSFETLLPGDIRRPTSSEAADPPFMPNQTNTVDLFPSEVARTAFSDPDLELRASAPASPPSAASSRAAGVPTLVPHHSGGVVEEELMGLGAAPLVASTPVSTSSPVWPIPVAMLVGVIVGVAIGFFVFTTPGRDAMVGGLAPAGDTVGAVSAPPAAPALNTPNTADRTPTVTGEQAAAVSTLAGVTSSPGTSAAASPPVPSESDVSPSTVAPRPAPTSGRDGEAVRPPDSRAARSSATRAETGARAAGGSGRLLVRTEPAGARVSLNGRDVGTTPTTVRAVPFGTHTLRVARDGYASAERRISLTASQPSQSVTVELEAGKRGVTNPESLLAGTLTIESRPSAAAVFLDDRRIGTTPLTVSSIAAGPHAIRLELEGYRQWTASVRVASEVRNRVAASLEPQR